MHGARLAKTLFALAVALALPREPLLRRAAASCCPIGQEVEDALPEGGSITGREIFERFLDNRLHSAVQYQTVISRDPGRERAALALLGALEGLPRRGPQGRRRRAREDAGQVRGARRHAPDRLPDGGERGPLERPVRLDAVERPRAARAAARRRRDGNRLHVRRHRLEERRGRRLRAPARTRRSTARRSTSSRSR